MLISVVIPLLNEEGNLRELHRRVAGVMEKLGCERRIIFVDDGSTDGSAEVIGELAKADGTVRGLRLSRNFGHEVASTAGLDEAKGDATVLMDADLQDPPELIEEMVQRWREGAKIVYAVRGKRLGEGVVKRGASWVFYRVLKGMSDVAIPADTGDFRLMDASVVEAMRRCREQDRFLRGLVAWTGFKSAAVRYDRPPRQTGRTKYPLLKLLWLSLDAAVGFSILPLRVATAIGFLVMLASLGVAGTVVVQKLFLGLGIPGYALLATGLFFLGGVQMLLLGILGEYIGRIYRQSQGRPLYLVAERMGGCGDA